jgi:hypothetical protein
MAPNELYDNKSTKELTVEIFLRKVSSINIAPPRVVRTTEIKAMNGPELSSVKRLERNTMMDKWFGWAKRRSLKHPVLKPEMIAFLKFLFRRGNVKGRSKSSPHTMRMLATKFGTPNPAFDDEEYWHEATKSSGGEPIFREEDIPEEWRVKQLISQFVAESNKIKRISEIMAPEDIRIKLIYLLGKDNPLYNKIPGNHEILADKLIDVGKSFHKISQADIKPLHEVSLKKYSKKDLQSISAVCKQMDKEITIEANDNTEEINEPTIDNINLDGIEDAYIIEENARLVAEHYDNQIEDENDYILSDDI